MKIIMEKIKSGQVTTPIRLNQTIIKKLNYLLLPLNKPSNVTEA